MGPRGRQHFGPALRRLRLPVRPTIVSLAFHGAFVAAVLWGNAVWGSSQTKTIYVSLVPAVAAVGTPQGSPPPARPLASRPEPAPPRPTAPQPAPAPDPRPPAAAGKPADLPQRESPRELPSREQAQSSLGLPDRGLPARAPGLPKPGEKELPRPGEKELPTVASVARASVPAPAPVTSTSARRELDPPTLGQASGVAEGVGALSLNVSDFPYAWYIAQIHRKIKERWDGYALAGQQPALIFEIGRDGDLRRVTIDKSSGNRYYDLAAVRAVTEAQPFPPLPADFKKSVLTVGLQFAFDPSAMR